MGDVANGFDYGLNAAATEFDGKNKYIRITDIDDETRMFVQERITSPDIELENADDYILKKGDVLFARTGASVGKSYIYRESDGIVYYAGFLIRAHVNEENDADFVYQNTLTESYYKYIQVTSQRSGQPGVNAKEYQEFSFLVPKKEEQVKISAYLLQLDHLITLHQRKMYVSKKSLTAVWEQRKLGEVFAERTERANGDEELLSVTIANGVIRQADSDKRNIASEDKSNYKIVCKGDVPYNSMRMWQGAVGNSEYDGIVSPAYTVLVPLGGSNGKFFMELFKKETSLKVFQRWSQGLTSDTWNLKYPVLATIEFSIPLPDEQKKIAEYFQSLDHLITLHQCKHIWGKKLSLYTRKQRKPNNLDAICNV